MANDANFDIKLLLDFKDAISGIQRFSSESSNSLKSVDSSLRSITTLAKSFAGVVAATFAFDKISGGIERAVKAASEGEESVNSLTAALKLSGDFTEAARASMLGFADSLQKTTKFSDDQALSSLALAKSFGITNERAVQLVTAASNLATVQGTDLLTATRQLGQTLDGTSGRLKEQIPILRGLTADQLKAGAAIDVVNDRFKGMAQAAGGTFSGSIAVLSNRFEDLLKVIGRIITQNPVVQQSIKFLGKSFDELSSFFQKNSAQIGNFLSKGLAGVAQIIPTIIEIVDAAVSGIQFLVTGIVLAGKAAADFINILLGLRFVNEIVLRLTQVITLAASGFLTILDLLTKLPGASRVFSAMGTSVEEISTSLNKMADSSAEFAANLDSEGIKTFGERLSSGAEKALDANASLFHTVHTGLDVAKSKAEDFAQAAEAASNRAAGGFHVVADSLENVKRKITLTAEQIKDLVQNPVKLLFNAELQNPTGFVASFSGMIAQILANGTTAVQDAKDQIGDTQAATRKTFQDSSDQINSDYKDSLDELNGKIKDGSISAVDAAKERVQLEKNYQKQLAEAQKKFAEQQLKDASVADKALREAQQKSVESSAKFLGKTFGSVIEKFLPGFGEIAGQLFELFAKGPEKVREFINEFADAIPDLIQNIVESIPVVIEALADKSPEIIQRLVERSPDIIAKLVEESPKVMIAMALGSPKVIGKMVEDAPKVIAKMVDGIPQFIGGLVSGAGRFIDELIKQLGDKLTGGGDKGPIGTITGGGGDGSKLDRFIRLINPVGNLTDHIIGGTIGDIAADPIGVGLNAVGLKAGLFQSSGVQLGSQPHSAVIASNTALAAKMDRVVDAVTTSKPTVVQIQVNQKDLAKAIFEINRLGYRTS